MKNRKLTAAFSSVALLSGLAFAFIINNTEDQFCKVRVGSPHLSTFFQKLNDSQSGNQILWESIRDSLD